MATVLLTQAALPRLPPATKSERPQALLGWDRTHPPNHVSLMWAAFVSARTTCPNRGRTEARVTVPLTYPEADPTEAHPHETVPLCSFLVFVFWKIYLFFH